MEGIKKKLAALKDEKDKAFEKVESMEQQKKEAEAKLEEVRIIQNPYKIHYWFNY